MMDYKEKYIKRLEDNGSTYQESFNNTAKRINAEKILNSHSRQDVFINLNDDIYYPCITRTLDGYKRIKFIFIPDTEVYIGDYVTYKNNTYLAISQNLDDLFPYLITEICNYNFIVKTEEVQTNEIIGRKSNGEPIFKKEIIKTTKPCIMTSNNYSSIDNSSVPMSEGSAKILLPYDESYELPKKNDKIEIWGTKYKVVDFNHENVIEINNVNKGYIEIRLEVEK